MHRMNRLIASAATAALLTLPVSAMAADDAVADAIKAAMQHSARTEAEVARDRNRKPVETLQFFRLEPDMRVLELVPGGGWYTKLLAQVLEEDGELHVALGTDRVRDNLVTQDDFDHVVVQEIDTGFERSGGFLQFTGDLDLDLDDVDLALTFRNLHNFTPDARRAMNEMVFEALKSGGYYGVVDHTRRHMQGNDSENRRRMDPVLAIKEIQEVGFELVDFSDLHYRPDDELRYEVGRKTVTGNTDRFTLLFRKP